MDNPAHEHVLPRVPASTRDRRPPDARHAALTRVFQHRMVAVLGLRRARPRVRALARWALRPMAAAGARTMTQFDDLAQAHGLPYASQWLLHQLVARVDVRGAQHIPAQGPLLVVFNHPSQVDVLAVLAGVQRSDVCVPGKPHPIGDALPSIRAIRVHVPQDAHARTATLRAMMDHLRAGGCVALSPAGAIEPDPAHHVEGADAALAGWSASPRLLAQQVPGLTVVPACVSGTYDVRLWQHPWLRRVAFGDDARMWLTLVLHWALPAARRTALRVVFGAPLPTSDPRALPGHMRAAMQQLYQCATLPHD